MHQSIEFSQPQDVVATSIQIFGTIDVDDIETTSNSEGPADANCSNKIYAREAACGAYGRTPAIVETNYSTSRSKWLISNFHSFFVMDIFS